MANTLGEIIDSLRKTPKMEKWEYYDTTVNYHGGNLEDYLNEKGKEGWELIKIFDDITETIEDKELVIRGRFIFKRKIQEG